VIATLVGTLELLRAMGRGVADPATRGVVLLALTTLGIGTVFYTNAEGWRLLDALYFSVVTLTTIGYGDLAPVTDGAKVFTIVYSLVGIGIIAAFVTSLAVNVRDRRDARHLAGARVRLRHDRGGRQARRGGDTSRPT
jgi:voltage-gated potassium channel